MVQAGALNAANPIICSYNIVSARSQLGLLLSWVKEEKKDKITHMHTQLKAQKLLTFYKLFTELSTWILQQPSNLQTAWLEVEKCKLCTFLLLFRPWSLCVLCMTPRLHWCLSSFYGCGIPWSLHMLHNNCKTTVCFYCFCGDVGSLVPAFATVRPHWQFYEVFDSI
jgi:hypothetical protein